MNVNIPRRIFRTLRIVGGMPTALMQTKNAVVLAPTKEFAARTLKTVSNMAFSPKQAHLTLLNNNIAICSDKLRHQFLKIMIHNFLGNRFAKQRICQGDTNARKHRTTIAKGQEL